MGGLRLGGWGMMLRGRLRGDEMGWDGSCLFFLFCFPFPLFGWVLMAFSDAFFCLGLGSGVLHDTTRCIFLGLGGKDKHGIAY